MMNRRRVLLTSLLLALAIPLTVEAQPAGTPHRIALPGWTAQPSPWSR